MRLSVRSLIVHPILFAIYPFLFFFLHNIGRIHLGILIFPAAVTIAAAALSWGAIAFIFKDAKRSAAIISLCLLSFFSCSHALKVTTAAIGRTVTVMGIVINTSILFFAIWVILSLACLLFLVRSRRPFDGITGFLNVMSVCLIAINLIGAGVDEFRMMSARERAAGVVDDHGRGTGTIPRPYKYALGSNENNPNIYYILVDAYAGADILRKVYDLDNGEFLKHLTAKGFYIAGSSHSNYCQTGLSAASSLNMRYLDTILNKTDMEAENMGLMEYMIRHNEVSGVLKKHGYRMVAFASGRPETTIRGADIYITPEKDFDASRSAVENISVVPAISAAIGKDPRYAAHRATLVNILDRLPGTTGIPGPIFVFAHIELPHPPFVFDRDGAPVDPDGEFTDNDGNWLIKSGALTREEYIRAYRDQLVFLNRRLEAVIDDILARSVRKPIIILQSDHGPRSGLVWEDPDRTHFKECMSILNAYYFPDGGYGDLYEWITPVNSFRIVLDRYFGGRYELLKDESYFSTARFPYKFINVTKKLGAKDN